jgi:hypothetical protein
MPTEMMKAMASVCGETRKLTSQAEMAVLLPAATSAGTKQNFP